MAWGSLWGAAPWGDGNAVLCSDPNVAAVVALNSVTVRVTFNGPMVDNPVLRFAGAYLLSSMVGHSPQVLSVTPEVTTNPTYVDLGTQEMRDGVTYRLDIHHLEEASATGCNTPGVLSVVTTGPDSVRVTFVTPVVDNQVLRFASAYEISNPHRTLQVLSVVPQPFVPNPTYVDLMMNEMMDAAVHTWTIHQLELA